MHCKAGKSTQTVWLGAKGVKSIHRAKTNLGRLIQNGLALAPVLRISLTQVIQGIVTCLTLLPAQKLNPPFTYSRFGILRQFTLAPPKLAVPITHCKHGRLKHLATVRPFIPRFPATKFKFGRQWFITLVLVLKVRPVKFDILVKQGKHISVTTGFEVINPVLRKPPIHSSCGKQIIGKQELEIQSPFVNFKQGMLSPIPEVTLLTISPLVLRSTSDGKSQAPVKQPLFTVLKQRPPAVVKHGTLYLLKHVLPTLATPTVPVVHTKQGKFTVFGLPPLMFSPASPTHLKDGKL